MSERNRIPPWERLGADLWLAAQNLRAQKTRTLLTALGMVFGVGAVIAMLAIGAGAKQQSLRLIEQLGVRNLMVDSIPTGSPQLLQQRRLTSAGLNAREVRILH
ncbi:MAG: ABC transporter permease, partial [Terriglobales bacterium]